MIESPRVSIETPHIKGSLSLIGSRFDDVTLTKYRETIDPTSPPIDLLSPMTATKPYFVEMGWLSADTNLRLPNATTLWTAQESGKALTESTPTVLTWDNGAGLRFTKTISADKDYMFIVEQTVENIGAQAATIYPYGLIARLDTPKTEGFFILHEGPLGVFNSTLKEMKYDDLKKEQRGRAVDHDVLVLAIELSDLVLQLEVRCGSQNLPPSPPCCIGWPTVCGI